jgi:hypothetical protein
MAPATKAALAAAKARGVKMGNPNGARCLEAAGKGNTAAIAAQQASAAAWQTRVLPIIAAIRAGGVTSPREIHFPVASSACRQSGSGSTRRPTRPRMR